MVIHCFQCGERKRLAGTRTPNGVRLRCQACGHEWERHPGLCDACGAERVSVVRLPLIQKARGAQQSIIGYRTVRECAACGASSGNTKPPENYTKDDA
jgi:uncharacterized Zn finger protein